MKYKKESMLAVFGGVGVLIASLPGSASAQSTPTQSAATAVANTEQEQRLRQQQQAREREQAVQAPAVRAQQAAPAEYPELPTETPCFRIDRFALEVPQDLPEAARTKGASALPQDPFAFAQTWLDHYNGTCIGKQGVEVLTKSISQAILSRGYVTTRVLLPQQDLSTGTMRFVLVPGMIGQIRFAQADVRGTWKSAFPSRPGDLLNLRDLEQGLEQMKRVASQDVDMQIVPTDVPGVSDVVISVKRAKPWTVVAAVDNSGTRSTG
ncbi:POTRA domain-containing protein, partial [Ralstonia solanacearum]